MVIGSVPYLNGKPLTRWFTHTDEGKNSGIEVRFDVPSELARLLATGEIDAALVSSFEYFKTPNYKIIPRVSISGQDEIMSVRAFSRVPWRSAQSIALDTSSLTSAALLKIILAEVYDSHPLYINHAPDLENMLLLADGALLIGDAGMLADNTAMLTIDLGSAWRKLTGHPFVYACWLARPDSISKELIKTLQIARDWGMTQTDIIAQEEAERLGCPVKLCKYYLTQIMDYNLSEEHLDGLEDFGKRARRHQLLDFEPASIEVASTRG